MTDDPIDLQITVNGAPVTTRVRADKLLVDFLHEDLGLTGTKFSCGIGQCAACKVAVQEEEDGALTAVLGCYARMRSVNGMRITTVEGLASGDVLHPLQTAFLEDYAFQCGFSTPGFLMAGYVLLDELRRAPVAWAKLDQVIQDAIGGHVCRCTGYVRYVQAIRRVILATPGLVVDDAPSPVAGSSVTFRIIKQSSNDLEPKVLLGRFERPTGEVAFIGGVDFDTCRASVVVRTDALATGEPARDLNLSRFFFIGSEELRFDLDRAWPIDRTTVPGDLLEGGVVPMTIAGTLRFGPLGIPAAMEVLVQARAPGRLGITARAPLKVDPRDLGFPIAAFAAEFGLELGTEVEIGFDLELPYVLR